MAACQPRVCPPTPNRAPYAPRPRTVPTPTHSPPRPHSLPRPHTVPTATPTTTHSPSTPSHHDCSPRTPREVRGEACGGFPCTPRRSVSPFGISEFSNSSVVWRHWAAALPCCLVQHVCPPGELPHQEGRRTSCRGRSRRQRWAPPVPARPRGSGGRRLGTQDTPWAGPAAGRAGPTHTGSHLSRAAHVLVLKARPRGRTGESHRTRGGAVAGVTPRSGPHSAPRAVRDACPPRGEVRGWACASGWGGGAGGRVCRGRCASCCAPDGQHGSLFPGSPPSPGLRSSG